jgi:hypothetical protein
MISTVDRLRLAALLGMLGSSHVGERENAAQLVEQFRRQRGLNWADLLAWRQMDDGARPQADRRPHDPTFAWTSAPPIGPGHRARDAIWRWSMLLGLAALALMSLTLLARQHAMEELIGVESDGRCADGAGTGTRPGCPPGMHAHDQHGLAPESATLAAVGSGLMPKPFAQGVADRKVYETWQTLAPPGLCTGRGGSERKVQSSDCAIARKLLAQFDERRRTDPVYRAGWNSLMP